MAPKPKYDFKISGPTHLNGTSIDWNNQHQRRIIMSSLVKAVYDLKNDQRKNRKGGNALAPPWWERFHFEKTKDLHDPKDNTIFGAIFKFNSPNHADNNSSTTRPPKYVIAFRGTSLKLDSIIEDMKNNIKLSFNRLHKSCRFEEATKDVKDTIAQNGGDEDTIWLAGHSLGAAIALTVRRDIVREPAGFHLPTYLFNPPRILIEDIKRLINTAVAKGYRNDDEEFYLLSNWVPNMFVNPKDRISPELMEYFEHRAMMENAGLGNIEKLAIPVAYLTINKDESQKPHALKQWWDEFQKAHALKQWWVEEAAFKGEYWYLWPKDGVTS